MHQATTRNRASSLKKIIGHWNVVLSPKGQNPPPHDLGSFVRLFKDQAGLHGADARTAPRFFQFPAFYA